ncbi:MAG: TonB-dependent receptor [Candidatus Marinimicrobia bacterium]|jgi:hypothetical protein|nr:TonB-dependent receptor [Candidatus Neomarinimicrobiota bacterium]|tara:strand:+ start:2756 stop:5194 length:2439 start_codon:yes stop_codon:yes gene_type:complete
MQKSFIILFFSSLIFGQKATQDITGIIVDMDNLEPLPYANVVIQDLERGITSNSDGHFVLVDVPAEPCTLVISYIGYRTIKIGYDNSQPGRPMDIRLKMEALDFQAVDVIADEYQIIKSSDDEISKVTLSPRQLALLPNMGEVDIFRSLQLLPGISSTGDGSSGINVRGGSSNQNMILLDGMNIYHVDHFFGMFSAFNADAIKDVQVYKGGFPAKYGGRLSSVIDMTGKNGDLTRRQFGLGANLMSAQLLYETPIILGGSWLLSFRRSYSDFMSSPFFDKMYEFVTGDDEVPTNNRRRVNQNNENQDQAFQQQIFPTFYFYDLHNKVTFTPGTRDVISISMYGGNDYLNESRQTEGVRRRPGSGGFGGGGGQQTITRIDDNKTDWGNLALSMRWNHRWTDRFSTQALYSSSRFISNYNRHLYSQGGGGRTFKIGEGNGAMDQSFRLDNVLYANENHILEFGLEVTNLGTHYDIALFDTVQVLDLESNTLLTSLYFEDRWRIFPSLTLGMGVRASAQTGLDSLLIMDLATDSVFVSPRLSLNWNVTDNFSIRGAWGNYFQFINNIVLEDVLQGNSNFWLVSDDNIPAGSAEHQILGMKYETRNYLLEIEGYRKYLDGLIEYTRRFQELADYGNYFFFGDGYAEGIELLVQKKSGAFNGWISYTFANVNYDFGALAPEPYPASHDKTHEAKLVGIYKWGPWNFATTLVYATGTPYTTPESRYYLPLLDGDEYNYIHVSDKNSHRLPDYHRMDLSVFRQLQTPDFNWDVGISVFNLYNRKNVNYREYDLDVVPVLVSDNLLLPITITLFFKVSLK